MKRVCKNVDITNEELIMTAIRRCMKNKSRKKRNRQDIVRIYKEHGTDEAIAHMMAAEIKARKLDLRPVYMKEVVDGSNGKVRTIGIEDIKRQFYNNLCFVALEELSHRIGEYQCTCIEGRGAVWGKERILGWMSDPKIKWVVQCDIRKNYQSVDHGKLMAFLRKHVANEDLLWLIETLLDTSGSEGLLIGSVLSVILDALYLSQIYHFAMEDLYKIRKHKDGTKERERLVEHAIFFVDDQSFYCRSQKSAKMAIKRVITYAADLGLTIKPGYTIRQITDTQHQDMLGYRIYRHKAAMRRRDYLKVKRELRKVDEDPDIHSCRSLIALSGIFIKHSDSYRFRKKYHTKRLVRKARRYVSRNEKRVRQQAGSSNHYDTGRCVHGADLHRRGSGAAPAGRGRAIHGLLV